MTTDSVPRTSSFYMSQKNETSLQSNVSKIERSNSDVEGVVSTSVASRDVRGLKDPALWNKNHFIDDASDNLIGYNLSSGTTFRGGIRKLRPHGNGILTCSDGYSYTGEFGRGEILGAGRLCVAGHVLEGEFDNGALLEGTHHLPNGTVYRGRPGVGGMWTGPRVSISFPDGREYNGEVANGAPDGRGRMSGRGGAWAYEGEFRGGVRHGSGVLTLPGGDTVDGLFADGRFVGPGAVQSGGGGGVVEGDIWVDGGVDGAGSLRCANGSRYDGDFAKGRMTGRGRMEHPPGEWGAEGAAAVGACGLVYEGGMLDGQANGDGVLTVGPSGPEAAVAVARLVGGWRAGLPHGPGRLEEPVGRRGEMRPVAAVRYTDGRRDGVFAGPGGDVLGSGEDLVASRASRA